uniref:nectin 1b-like isoform X2 n=1 Tax=Pristiophorus japonicus TaxID=55135 RepID=UPI00398E863B
MATLNLNLAFICLHILAVCQAQHVKVELEVTGFLGSQAILRCQFVDPDESLKVTQVSWMKDSAGTKVNLAVYNPEYGTHYAPAYEGRIQFRQVSLRDATLVIGQLEMGDDGIYSCEFATYPDGNQEAATNLTILVEPVNSGKALLVKAGPAEVPLAVCTSANGKPAASITWKRDVAGNVSTTQTKNTDGTITVKSHFTAVPSGMLDGETVTCEVTQRTLEQAASIPIALSVQYSPIVTIEGYDGNWYLKREHASLTCNVKANPAATEYKWLMNGGPVPDSVEVKGHQLTVTEVTYDFNGTITCEAVNSIGEGHDKMDIIVREQEASQLSNAGAIAGGVIGGILALLLVACLVGFFLHKRQRDAAASSYDPKTRVFGERNGAPQPDYTYRPDSDSEKGPSLTATTTASAEAHQPAEAENLLQIQPPIYANSEDAESASGKGPVFARRGTHPEMEDDMESQHDGSIISKKAVYV